jgi:peptidase M23-like protein/transglycosylase-like protein with SLT domain
LTLFAEMTHTDWMLATLAPLSLVLLAAELPDANTAAIAPAVAAEAAAGNVVAGLRQRPSPVTPKRGIHELKDPGGWPAEPAAITEPIDAARFDAAVTKLCGEVARDEGLPEIARVVREVSAQTNSDPFLLAALAYRGSRCRPWLVSSTGVGLLQIKASMFATGAKLPFPRADLDRERLLDPAHNVRVGAALLAMWEAEHVAIDRAIGSTPHRTAVAHFFWGDKVWGATPEDRTLTARRRLIEAYDNQPVAFQTSSLELPITSPLEGTPRLGTSGLGVDRDGGERSHRGVDIDATIGEPVRAVADGVVVFAGVDMKGDHPALGLFPRQLKRWRRKVNMMGPGGFFVRVVHDGGVRSGYFHLNTFRVEAGQTVRAGEIIGTVGRTGVKASGSHLHFEVHKDGDLKDPARFLSAFVLPPERTITFTIAKAEKRQRLARAARARRQAQAAAQHRLS